VRLRDTRRRTSFEPAMELMRVRDWSTNHLSLHQPLGRLYGVTMAERGVSQLVSVDLQGAVKLREAS
jgi:hypothetical protein